MISIVVPIYNEEEIVKMFHSAVADRAARRFPRPMGASRRSGDRDRHRQHAVRAGADR